VIDSVVAGKPDFIAILGPTVRAMAGGEPRVASDPRQAFTFCAQTGGLLVVQYGGQEWLPVVRDLRSLCGDGISLVVAVSPDKLSEVGHLQHAGADEVVPWEGKADAVAWAIERSLAARGQGRGAAPTPAPPVLTFVAPAGAPPPVLQRGPVASAAPTGPVPAVAPPPLVAGAAPAAPQPLRPAVARPPSGPPAWPANLPGAEESARLLLAAVAGEALEPGPLAEAAAGAAEKLSQPERDAVAGRPLPVDAAVIQRAAVLRFRVALALHTAPRPGGAGDAGAVQALLAEIDGVLAELKVLEEGAPPAAQPGLDTIRSGLVSEAIDLTEAVQRLAPAPPPQTETAPKPAARRPAEKKAVESRAAEFEGLKQRQGGRNAMLALLVLSALAAAGYHLMERFGPRPVAERPTMPGAPANAVAPANDRGGPRVVVSQDGKPFEREQVEQFRREQAERGNEVVQVSPTTLLVKPAGSRK